MADVILDVRRSCYALGQQRKECGCCVPLWLSAFYTYIMFECFFCFEDCELSLTEGTMSTSVENVGSGELEKEAVITHASTPVYVEPLSIAHCLNG